MLPAAGRDDATSPFNTKWTKDADAHAAILRGPSGRLQGKAVAPGAEAPGRPPPSKAVIEPTRHTRVGDQSLGCRLRMIASEADADARLETLIETLPNRASVPVMLEYALSPSPLIWVTVPTLPFACTLAS